MSDSDRIYNFKKQLKQLEQYRGSGTELISVYIPAGSPVHEMNNKLREEMSQASNIKSKSTKTNVLGALEKIMNHLKIYRKTPENGISVFAGNVSDNEAKVDIELFSVDPPLPLSIGAYRCDSKFFLEPLQNMLETKESYGIVAVDGRDATLAPVKGTHIDIVRKLHSTAHAKIRKGGQSARRYERLIQEQTEVYYKRLGGAMDEAFLNRVKGIIIGGPGPTKEFFMKMKPFNYQLDVLGVVDVGYTDEYGVREILAKSEDLIAQQDVIKERKLVERFIRGVVKEDMAVYGERQVREAMEKGQAEVVLLSEGLEYTSAQYKCQACGLEKAKTSREQPGESIQCTCGGNMRLQKKSPLIEELADLARSYGIEIEMISDNTTEGSQFLSGFGGVGAFLRYKTR